MGIKHATTGAGTKVTNTVWSEDHTIDGTVTPDTDDSYDLGSATAEFKDLYIDGTANIDTATIDSATISAGTATLTTATITTLTSATQTRGNCFVWKDVSVNALTAAAQAASIDWTDLDLTASTSASAKIALVRIQLVSNVASKLYYLAIRKNGTTPDAYPILLITAATDHTVALYDVTPVGLDSGQVIEYKLSVEAGGNCDIIIDVLGYWE